MDEKLAEVFTIIPKSEGGDGYMPSKVMNMEEVLNLIKENQTISTAGFAGAGVAEEVLAALEKRFLETGSPKNLTVLYAAGQGNWKDGGIQHFAHEGMIKRVIGGHFDTCRNLVELINANKVEAYNLPQGVICHLYRAIAGNKPGVITKVGLKTYIDPRLQGGKMNDVTKTDIVRLIELNDEEWLLYPSMPIDIAIIRGTTADELGNITMEEEAVLTEALDVAMAVKASGGKVIAQVKYLAKADTLDAQLVKVPGTIIDAVVISREPEKYHRQTWVKYYDPAMAGHIKVPLASIPPMPLDERKIIARRSSMELVPDAVINLGIGVPEGVATVAAEEGVENLTLTVEAGPTGGIPAPGLSFGAGINPWAIIDHTHQFDFYDGGGVDVAFLGLAEVDIKGNLNVSKFGPKIAGCGGFINITQNAKKVVFCGTFTAGGLQLQIKDGKLSIIQEGKYKKFVSNVQQITFSGEYAASINQPVYYITERAVFKLGNEGLILTEIAPGIDLEEDIIKQMEFKPNIAKDLRIMDAALFHKKSMGLKKLLGNLNIYGNA